MSDVQRDAPRDAHRELIKTLLGRAGGDAAVVADRCRPWMSATFAGMRHVIELAMPPAAASAFREGIEEAEFVMRGHILADIVAEPTCAGVRIEALTISDAA